MNVFFCNLKGGWMTGWNRIGIWNRGELLIPPDMNAIWFSEKKYRRLWKTKLRMTRIFLELRITKAGLKYMMRIYWNLEGKPEKLLTDKINITLHETISNQFLTRCGNRLVDCSAYQKYKKYIKNGLVKLALARKNAGKRYCRRHYRRLKHAREVCADHFFS